MSKHAYEIKTSVDFFKKVLDEREDCLREPTSSRHAMNFSITAWHLHEWIWAEYKRPLLKKRFNNKEGFIEYLFKRSELKTIKDLANGSKHFIIGESDNTIVSTELLPAGQYGPFKKLQSTAMLIVKTKRMGGLTMTFDDLMYSITHFWYQFFDKELPVDVSAILNEGGYTWF
jgi:hypothetical protein